MKAGLLAMALVASEIVLFGVVLESGVLGVLPICLATAAGVLFLEDAKTYREISEMEREIPKFLMKFSRIRRGKSARELFLVMEEGTTLSRLLKRAERQFARSSGRTPLEESVRRELFPYAARSWKLAEFSDALAFGIERNSSAAPLLARTCANMEEISGLEEERSAALALQKYSLLLTGGFFVPFLLGASSGISGIVSLVVAGNPASSGLAESLFGYSMILPGICAAFVALLIEGRKDRLPSYLLGLYAAAVLSFGAARGLL